MSGVMELKIESTHKLKLDLLHANLITNWHTGEAQTKVVNGALFHFSTDPLCFQCVLNV